MEQCTEWKKIIERLDRRYNEKYLVNISTIDGAHTCYLVCENESYVNMFWDIKKGKISATVGERII